MQTTSSASAIDATNRGYVNSGPVHKLIIGGAELEVYNELASRGAIVDELDYGSFKMVRVNEQALGGRESFSALSLPVRDDQDLINLNGFVLDTTQPELLRANLPAELRQTDMADAIATGTAPQGGLYIVQFAGPIKDSWLRKLRATGVEIVSYLSSNAYILRASRAAAESLPRFKADNSFVQFLGDYEPVFKMTPAMRAAHASSSDALVYVTVQVLAGPDAHQTIARLRQIAGGSVNSPVSSYDVLNYRNVELSMPASSLAELAHINNVFAIEERTARIRLDEAQGQIVAGNLSGNIPIGPGYLSWLAGKGFTSSQFGSFSVNVADDTYTLMGHPDFPASRVAFQNNPTNQTGVLGGHGFLNANIVGGFNNGIGSAVEDANGFNYGLGIAPFARVGVTAIFGNTSSSGTVWENTAYGQGARLSSNSWGFTNVFRYDTNAQAYDFIVRDAQTGVSGLQQMTVVFAAGNNGSGANTVGSPGTAKNVICVGASENVRQTGTDGCAIANSGADSANDIISFSSRGPVNSAGGDGRIKPDIAAPGTHIEAGVPQSNYDGSSVCDKFFPAGQTLYGWSSGTSHSTPAVAGGSALVFQDFLNKALGAPSPAMVKAMLMNSAAYMTGVGAGGSLPSNSQGMGRMDLGRAFDSSARILVDQTQVLGATGQTYQTTGSVSDTSKPFRVTLAWTDAPGPTTGAPWVNNLDLEVTVGAVTYKGNVFSGANSVSGGAADTKNNVESVFLPAGTSGNFTVTVRATNIAGDGVPGNADTTDQDFALVVYNAGASSGSPTIGVSPSSFSFSATAGGSNPASQSLSITNTGGGTLNWSASSNASWLSVSPTSGTAPSTATVSANITGLAAGTYNGAITISATGATNTPVAVPVTLTVSSQSAELIVNGGFEINSTPWVLSGGALRSTGSFPHTGTGYLIVASADNDIGAAYQQVSVPTGSALALTFWLNVTSSETTTTTQFDKLFIEVRNTSGTLLSTLATFSNLNKGTAGVYVLRGPFTLSGFAGQTVRIQFRATNDVSLPTSFRVDDVSAH